MDDKVCKLLCVDKIYRTETLRHETKQIGFINWKFITTHYISHHLCLASSWFSQPFFSVKTCFQWLELGSLIDSTIDKVLIEG